MRIMLSTLGTLTMLAGAAAAQAQSSESRFTPDLRPGQELQAENIDGDITITQRAGPAVIVAHKTVRRGDGNLVKAVLERTDNGYRLCTVYLDEVTDSASCNYRREGNHHGDRDLDVDVRYDIELPAGVTLTAHSVDGNIEARNIDAGASIHTVDGNITYSGVPANTLETVDGWVKATFTSTRWTHDVTVHSVDGELTLTLPAGSAFSLDGKTVDGDMDSDFPVNAVGRFGSHSFHGSVGTGGDHTLRVETVDGSIHIHRAGEGD